MTNRLAFPILMFAASIVVTQATEQILNPGTYHAIQPVGHNITLELKVNEGNEVLARFITISSMIGENGEVDLWLREIGGKIEKNKKGKVVFVTKEGQDNWPLGLEFDQVSETKIQALDTPWGYRSIQRGNQTEMKKELIVIELLAEQ